MEQQWQPEPFLFLPGFLDKNNDLLFRNLKEVSMDKGCFQYSAEQGVCFKMGWNLREKVFLIPIWRTALRKDRLRLPKFVLLKTTTQTPFITHFCKSCLKFILWKLVSECCISLQTMCNSENPIINQCFDRTELTDKKRPETVRTRELLEMWLLPLL